MSDSNITAVEAVSPVGEATLGTITLICFLIGVPGNLLASIYFVQEHINNSRNTKKIFFTEIYICMTGVDLMLTATLFPIIENYFNGARAGVLFSDLNFCAVWGFLWEIVPCISVFLVGLLSLSRMLILVWPMQSLNLNVLRGVLGTYLLYHIIVRITAVYADDKPSFYSIKYSETTAYCYFAPENTDLWYFNAYHAGVVLGLPILPISFSFFASIVKLRESTNSPSAQSFSRVAQTQATITIIIVTSVYLICNMPVFLNYCYYSHVIINDNDDWEDYFSIYSKKQTFMGWYIWNLTYVVLVAVNAAINPLVFLFRMKPFREFVKALIPFRKKTLTQTKSVHLPGKSIREVTSSSF